jgi:hypothetical protein
MVNLRRYEIAVGYPFVHERLWRDSIDRLEYTDRPSYWGNGEEAASEA